MDIFRQLRSTVNKAFEAGDSLDIKVDNKGMKITSHIKTPENKPMPRGYADGTGDVSPGLQWLTGTKDYDKVFTPEELMGMQRSLYGYGQQAAREAELDAQALAAEENDPLNEAYVEDLPEDAMDYVSASDGQLWRWSLVPRWSDKAKAEIARRKGLGVWDPEAVSEAEKATVTPDGEDRRGIHPPSGIAYEDMDEQQLQIVSNGGGLFGRMASKEIQRRSDLEALLSDAEGFGSEAEAAQFGDDGRLAFEETQADNREAARAELLANQTDFAGVSDEELRDMYKVYGNKAAGTEINRRKDERDAYALSLDDELIESGFRADEVSRQKQEQIEAANVIANENQAAYDEAAFSDDGSVAISNDFSGYTDAELMKAEEEVLLHGTDAQITSFYSELDKRDTTELNALANESQAAYEAEALGADTGIAQTKDLSILTDAELEARLNAEAAKGIGGDHTYGQALADEKKRRTLVDETVLHTAEENQEAYEEASSAEAASYEGEAVKIIETHTTDDNKTAIEETKTEINDAKTPQEVQNAVGKFAGIFGYSNTELLGALLKYGMARLAGVGAGQAFSAAVSHADSAKNVRVGEERADKERATTTKLTQIQQATRATAPAGTTGDALAAWQKENDAKIDKLWADIGKLNGWSAEDTAAARYRQENKPSDVKVGGSIGEQNIPNVGTVEVFKATVNGKPATGFYKDGQFVVLNQSGTPVYTTSDATVTGVIERGNVKDGDKGHAQLLVGRISQMYKDADPNFDPNSTEGRALISSTFNSMYGQYRDGKGWLWDTYSNLSEIPASAIKRSAAEQLKGGKASIPFNQWQSIFGLNDEQWTSIQAITAGNEGTPQERYEKAVDKLLLFITKSA